MWKETGQSVSDDIRGSEHRRECVDTCGERRGLLERVDCEVKGEEV